MSDIIQKVLSEEDALVFGIDATNTRGEGFLATRFSVDSSTENVLLNDLDSEDILQITL